MGSALLLVHLVKVIDEIRPQPCGTEEKENFSRTRSQMLAALPLPRRFLGRIRGPKGAQIHQRWHVGNLWQENPADRWEDYWGNVVHVL